MQQHKSILYIIKTSPPPCSLTQEAIDDKQLPADTLALLLWLCNQKKPTLEQAITRFGKNSRKWWTRKLSTLIELGYAYYHKTSEGRNKFVHFYIISDSSNFLSSFDMNSLVKKPSGRYYQGSNMTPESIYQGSNMTPENFTDNRKMPEVAKEIPEKTEDFQGSKMSPKRSINNNIYIKDNGKYKLLDPLTAPKSFDYALGEFYIENKHPLPETEDEWNEAVKPGMKCWAQITRNFVGWVNAEEINKTLGDTPNAQALDKAWKKWNTFPYQTNNLHGILGWYNAFCKDINAQPWEYKRRNNNGAGKNYRKPIRKEHGISQQTNQQPLVEIT
jgi:hypothetical protein